ncbi:hypothetical protein SHA02_19110 [Salisediminibacterium halotolerans]|nr:hypothetical protein SHA02_19110 [Salisediminibacterium halotolerans]
MRLLFLYNNGRLSIEKETDDEKMGGYHRCDPIGGCDFVRALVLYGKIE